MSRGALRHRRPRLRASFVAAFLILGGCSAPAASIRTFPPVGSTPAPVGTATADASAAVTAALAAVGLQAVESATSYRPAEGAILAGVPRSLLEVTLPDDPGRAFVVLYSLPTPEAADVAARDQAAYVTSGPGRVQFAADTRFVLRVVGSTVVFFAWSPANAPDRRTPAIEQALATVGAAVAVPG